MLTSGGRAIIENEQRLEEVMMDQRLVQENENIRWSVVIGAYRDKQINLGKAAKLLGLTEFELRQRFIELGVPLRIGPVDLAEARAERQGLVRA